MAVNIVKREDVELVRTGTYNLSTGEHTFTEEDLAAMVEAAHDPGMPAPRIKLGHTDPREGFGGGAEESVETALAAAWAELDGEPALGWVSDIALAPDGQRITGTLNVPEGLGEMLDYAFPGRSVEAWPKITSGTQRVHEWAMTAVSLLGVKLPAVLNLDDLFELHAMIGGAEASAPVEVVTATVGAQRAPDTEPVFASIGTPVAAGLDVHLVQSRFVDTIDDPDSDDDLIPEGATAWAMWPTSIRLDDDGTPYLKATDENSGRLYRYDFTVSGAEVTFTLAGEIIEQDVLAASLPSDRIPEPRPVMARWSSRAQARNISASTQTPNQEDASPMTDEQRVALARALGLPEATDEATLHATAAERAAAEETPEGTPPPETPPEGEPAPEGEPQGEPQAAAASGRMVQIDRDVWERTQAQAASGAEAREQQVRAERDALVQAAIEDGRITPASAGLARQGDGTLPEGWRRDLDESPEVTARALERLEAGKYPGNARASGRTTSSNSDGTARVVQSIGARRGDHEPGKVIHR